MRRLTPSGPLACVLLFGVALLLVAGCGGGGEKLVEVKGRITVGGNPLTRGTLSLIPDKGNATASEPYGQVEPDGTYMLYTAKKKGAPLGKYSVLVEASEEIDPKNPSATPKALVPAKYSIREKPLLTLEVVETGGKYDLTLDK
jgi:hypothetical protein